MKKQFTKGYEDISGTFWGIFLDSAKKRNIEIDIDIKYLWNLYIKQNKKCALSGVSIVLDKFGNKKEKLNKNIYFASLDRINNKLGYVDGNVRWVAREINNMKWKFTDEQFLFFCEKINTAYENKN